MQNKYLKDNYTKYEKQYHPTIKGLQIIDGKNNFSISWLNIMAYCEYQIKLQYLDGITVKRTQEMKTGTTEHQKLENNFLKTAKPATLKEMIDTSHKEKTISRELFIISKKYGIRGFIDEIWMTPENIIIIDDKPGTTPYPSSINQIRAYCLGFKDMVKDKRPLIGALRQRGTDNIFYTEEFQETEKTDIKQKINRLHDILNGIKPTISTKNPNKCKSCRFQSYCREAKI